MHALEDSQGVVELVAGQSGVALEASYAGIADSGSVDVIEEIEQGTEWYKAVRGLSDQADLGRSLGYEPKVDLASQTTLSLGIDVDPVSRTIVRLLVVHFAS